MFVQSDLALIGAEPILGNSEHEVWLVIIDLVSVVALCRLGFVFPENQNPGGGVSQVTTTDEVVLVRHALLALRALAFSHVVAN